MRHSQEPETAMPPDDPDVAAVEKTEDEED